MRLSVTCFISLANTEEAPLTDNLARLVEIEGKRCTNRRVPYLISAGIFFNAHGRRFSKSSTVAAWGSAVNTWRRY